jgi:hypothetical protein
MARDQRSNQLIYFFSFFLSLDISPRILTFLWPGCFLSILHIGLIQGAGSSADMPCPSERVYNCINPPKTLESKEENQK